MMLHSFEVPVDGGLIHGESRGPDPALAPPLAFLHGMTGTGADWDRVWQHLPPDIALLRHDLRGFGRSETIPGHAFSHTEDLLALLDARGIGRVTLVGLSMGGAVALNFALSHPDRVERLVLVSPAMVAWEWSDEWKGTWREICRAAKAGNFAQAREIWWQHPMFDTVRASQAGSELRGAIEQYHGRQWIRDDQRAELPDIDRLATLAVPTLLLTGECDVADMRLIADVIAGSVPKVTRIDFAGAGHMLQLERAQAVAAAIVEPGTE